MHRPTAQLLGEVFEDSRLGSVEYLRWLYDESPAGPAVQSNVEDDAGRTGHLALVPSRLVGPRSASTGALAVNLAVHSRARGAGNFVRLGREVLARAREAGIVSVYGVANANAIHGHLKYLGFHHLGPLPVTMLTRTPVGIQPTSSRWADAAGIRAVTEDPQLPALLGDPPERGWAPGWSPGLLRWRLAAPGAHYALHRADGVLAVSTRDPRQRLRVAVVLKVFSSHVVRGVAAARLVNAICRFHEARLAVYAGHNDRVSFAGISLPLRLRPSPLHLIHQWLDGRAADLAFARLEFLDFDAY